MLLIRFTDGEVRAIYRELCKSWIKEPELEEFVRILGGYLDDPQSIPTQLELPFTRHAADSTASATK